MKTDTRKQFILDQLGNPTDIDRELQNFRKSARVLSSTRVHLIDSYQKKWIAVYDGKTKAQGRTLQLLWKQVDKMGIPREYTIVRYIDKNQRTMIL